MPVVLTMRRAGFKQGRQVIFRGVDLEAHTGEVVCLLGPNGCGKTTLLKCLCGLLKLDEGEIVLREHPLSTLSAVSVAKRVGMVFQEHAAQFPYPVLQIVLMGRAPHLGMFAAPSADDIVVARAALSMVGMQHLEDRPYTQISGGERQLVLIARALAQETEILLLDEPTSHLDFGNQISVLTTIQRLAKEKGLAVIITTHYPNHALAYADTAALMIRGGFIAVGKPDDVITEDNMRKIYGIETKVISIHTEDGGDEKYVVPVSPHHDR